MAFKKAKKKEQENTDAWLVTYADAITLVLVFFILMFSVSEPKDAEFRKIAEAFQAAGFVQEITEDPLQMMKEEIEILIEENNMEKDMSIEETEDGIMLELSSSSFYHSGSAKFKREALPILEQVSVILREFDFDAYEISVDGHTDDVPIKSAQFPSNWELAGGRAANIVRFFIIQGITPELLYAASYADVSPKVPNLDEDGTPIAANRDINRRVVVNVQRVD